MSEPGTDRTIDRRRFMVRSCGVAAACLSAPLLTILGGCSQEPEPDGKPAPLKLALAELPIGSRVLFAYGDRTVEVVRTESGCRARVMLCTHQGCNISWVEDEQYYLCACHKGRFNDQGDPIYGPPRKPLRELNVTLTPTEAIIGT